MYTLEDKLINNNKMVQVCFKNERMNEGFELETKTKNTFLYYPSICTEVSDACFSYM
jgi:hypothetical protein